MEITDHGAEATRHLQAFLGEHYHYSEKPVFKALWDNYNDCQFVEDEGALGSLHKKELAPSSSLLHVSLSYQ